MISEFIRPKKILNEIYPPLDVDKLSDNNGEYWELYSADYQNFIWKDDIFSHAEINKIIKIGKYLNPHRAKTSGSGEECLDHRRSFVSWININSQTEWIYKKITDNVLQINKEWYDFDLEKIEKLQFTYYNSEELGCYKPHIDPMNWQLPHNRKLSFVVQLSHPEDYDGGELRLHIGHEPCVIEKKRGMGVFFPSYILHEVTPVTRGERYSLVAWVHGKPFK